MKKTILEWYEQLPEPIRSQAIENYDGTKRLVGCYSEAIGSGIYWGDTPQGYAYWDDICERAEKGEFDTPIESDLVKAAKKVVQYKDLEMDGDLYTAIHELEKALK